MTLDIPEIQEIKQELTGIKQEVEKINGREIISAELVSKINNSEDIELLTIKEVAALWKTDARTIYKRKEEGKLPYVKIGSSLRFRKLDVHNYIMNNLIGFNKKSLENKSP